ncbi:hypothetical protein GUY44_20700 [Pimelobacter simplex]|uniref:hypothetical protein n=1 Tax=Nocardioides simplex TaxID=2045 RepID=UPI000535EB71|nr:hypothetical protein [Pimelobacter simplex]MCG8152914.1 hypothetical protein [Pimelobacter simplex]GEB11882.1 hypothetical protein NSI01_01970 [Pimelobacter simplex]SFN03002.1 hypothetical protein SAMN05421671_4742 [Pimelobacter simplex]
MNHRVPRLRGALAATAAALLLVLSTTTDARAATTYTPSGGPGLSLSASYDDPRTPETTLVPGAELTLIDAGQSIDCSGLSFSGWVTSPGSARAYGATMAALGTFSAPGCTNPTYGPTTLDLQTAPQLVITGGPADGQWPARITNIRWKIAWPGCDFSIEGIVVGRLDAATQVFTPAGNPGTGPSSTPSGLVIASSPTPSGPACLTLDLQGGDHIGLRGTFLNTPPAGSSALVLPTYSPSGGPGFGLTGSYDDPRTPGTAIVPGVQLSLIEPAQGISCSGFSFSGSVSSPGVARTYGVGAASLGTSSAPGCTNPLFGTVTFASLTSPRFDVTGDPVGGQWPSRIANLKWKVSWANCVFYVEGVINGKFDPATQVFAPAGNPGSGWWSDVPTGLVVAATPAPPTGSMCLTVDLRAGDTIGIRGTFTNTPPAGSSGLAITNP